MCGIVGAIGFADEDLLSAMLDAIVHRGPDEEGRYVNSETPIMAGVRRLSIIDVENGSQPIWNEDRTVCVTFNGEIYNHAQLRKRLQDKGHRFTTGADTEVIVHLWEEYGEDCPSYLDGMFAFAVWDLSDQTLFLARDRLGIKPLYYAQPDDRFLWGSELPPLLLGLPQWSLDPTALAHYFSLSYFPAPRTPVSDVKKLPPGCSLTVTQSAVTQNRYWELEVADQHTDRSFIVDGIRSRLEQSVGERLMADVPLGAFLSGGLDSSAIVGIMADLQDDPVRTFSARFRSAEFDESSMASYVANEFGTDHTEVPIDLSSLEALEDLLSRSSEPLGDPATLPTAALARRASQDVKVVLTGTGGDELFSGYDRWNTVVRHREFVKPLPDPLFRAAELYRDKVPIGNKYARYLSSLETDASMAVNVTSGDALVDDDSTDDWVTVDQESLAESTTDLVRRQFGACDTTKIRTERYLLRSALPDRLLYKTDTASMAHSLEARVPYLDHELVAFAQRIPAAMKVDGEYKPLLREAVSDLVPERVLSRDKHGFAVPVDQWIRERSEPVERWLSEDALDRTPLLDTERVRSAYVAHYRGEQNNHRMLWRTLAFTAWYDRISRLEKIGTVAI